MDYHLVCIHPFGKYKRSDVVTDDEEAAALHEAHKDLFVRVLVGAVPMPPIAAPEAPPSTRSTPTSS
jgi:hypothetical protein